MIVDILSPWHVSSNETWNWTNPKIAFNTDSNIFYILNHLHYTSFTMTLSATKYPQMAFWKLQLWEQFESRYL
jgi:hypothetical protein